LEELQFMKKENDILNEELEKKDNELEELKSIKNKIYILKEKLNKKENELEDLQFVKKENDILNEELEKKDNELEDLQFVKKENDILNEELEKQNERMINDIATQKNDIATQKAVFQEMLRKQENEFKGKEDDYETLENISARDSDSEEEEEEEDKDVVGQKIANSLNLKEESKDKKKTLETPKFKEANTKKNMYRKCCACDNKTESPIKEKNPVPKVKKTKDAISNKLINVETN